MSRETHVQFCEGLGVQLPGATHPVHGGANFVAHVGEKLAFGTVGSLGGVFGFLQNVLIKPAVGDVFRGSNHTIEFAFGVQDRKCAVADPAQVPVGADNAVLVIG